MKRFILLAVIVGCLWPSSAIANPPVVQGNIECTFPAYGSLAGCLTPGETPLVLDSSNKDGLGAYYMANLSGDLPIVWVDDGVSNDPNAYLDGTEASVVAGECDLWQTWGIHIRRVILAGIPQGFDGQSPPHTFFGCDSTDSPYTEVINVMEAYPYWDTGSDGDENSGGTANDVEQQYSLSNTGQFACKWGWLTQLNFGWPANEGPSTAWNNPAPTNVQAIGLYDEAQNDCLEFPHRFYYTDGSPAYWTSGFQGQY